MNKWRYLTVLVLLFLVAAGCQTAGTPGDENQAEEFRPALIQLTLERALVDEEIPDYGLLVGDGNQVVLSTENIDLNEAPPVPGFELELLTPEEIQVRANEEGDFLFLRFGPIEEVGAGTVTVTLDNAWATAEDSTTGYLSGGGFELLYKRLPDGWQGEIVALWMS